MINYKNNQTLKFIMPLVMDIPAKVLITENLIGAFIGDVERPEWDGNLLLAYNYPYTVDYAKLDAKICRHTNYMTSYDYPDKRITIYILSIPDQYKDDVGLILDGKYSQLSPQSKLIISKYWIDYSGDHLVEEILNGENSDYLKEVWNQIGKNSIEQKVDGEYWFKPVIDNELFSMVDY